MIQTRSAYRKQYIDGEGDIKSQLVAFLQIIDDGGIPTRTEAKLLKGLLVGKKIVVDDVVVPGEPEVVS